MVNKGQSQKFLIEIFLVETDSECFKTYLNRNSRNPKSFPVQNFLLGLCRFWRKLWKNDKVKTFWSQIFFWSESTQNVSKRIQNRINSWKNPGPCPLPSLWSRGGGGPDTLPISQKILLETGEFLGRKSFCPWKLKLIRSLQKYRIAVIFSKFSSKSYKILVPLSKCVPHSCKNFHKVTILNSKDI